MSQAKSKYPIDQCALYKCGSKKRLESILTIETGGLKDIQYAIRYRSFEIAKKHSPEKRKITAPELTLKAVQSRILALLQRIERPAWLISGERGKCYIDNGRAHIDSNYMLALDIKKFYDNCRRDAVYQFFLKQMRTAPDVAKILTDIVTYDNGIPTGCPTSQLIAYYAYEEMFMRVNNCAVLYDCKFTLYVDDMTFSSNRPFAWERLAREVDIILRQYGHKPKYTKVKFYSRDAAKPITGTVITTDHRLDVPNSLQKKVYYNFQELKTLKDQDIPDASYKTIQILLGQIQASRNIDPTRFPEISRLTNTIRKEIGYEPKAATCRRRKNHSKIKIPGPRTK